MPHQSSSFFLLPLWLLFALSVVSPNIVVITTAALTIPTTSKSSITTSSSKQQQQRPLHLLTFDLDNTLFPLTPVLKDANDAMIKSLTSFGYHDATVESITSHSKQIRLEIQDGSSSSSKDITYSELRRRSIQREIMTLRRHRSSSIQRQLPIGNVDDDDDIVTRTFDAWLTERNASANRYLFPDCVDTLSHLRHRYPNVCIGAVTNGRGTPFEMPRITQFFDFCVSGEDEGVFPQRKPHPGIYDVAKARGGMVTAAAGDDDDDDGAMDGGSNEGVWVHVGDDLANDVGGSVMRGALAIWMDFEEEINGGGIGWSTASKKEKEMREKLDEEAKSFVSARITSLKELPDRITDLLNY